jgi:hypothetical protein
MIDRIYIGEQISYVKPESVFPPRSVLLVISCQSRPLRPSPIFLTFFKHVTTGVFKEKAVLKLIM